MEQSMRQGTLFFITAAAIDALSTSLGEVIEATGLQPADLKLSLATLSLGAFLAYTREKPEDLLETFSNLAGLLDLIDALSTEKRNGLSNSTGTTQENRTTV